MSRLRQLLRRGTVVEMTIRADELRPGDRMLPSGRRVIRIKTHGEDLDDTGIYVVFASGRPRATDMFLPGEPVTVERRVPLTVRSGRPRDQGRS